MTYYGAIRSENAGMSNRNAREIRADRKLKVSLAMIIIQGLGGPNLFGESQMGMGSGLILPPSGWILKNDAGE